ncbi:dockerin type I repeat-containing protein [Litoricola sp.]|nr:dockerin type I repeat-containing protein [Litorivicinus sp.]
MATTESANNNTITNADQLDLGSTLTGGLTSTDVDYFKVSGDDISVDSLVDVVFTPTVPGVGKEWTIDLVNAAGTSLITGGAQNVTAATTLSARVNDTDGAVYLKVSPSQYSGSMDYTVLANAAPAVESEDNDSLNKATPLTKGVSVEGVLGSTSSPEGDDVDFYLFTVADAGTISIALQSPTSTASSNIYTAKVQTADGQTVVYNGQQVTQTFGAQSTTSTIEFAGSAGSTYFLEIAASSGEETNFTSADDDREAYTLEFTGTATLNEEPVVTIGSKSSAARGTTIDSGVSQSVKINTSFNLTDVVEVTDAQGDDTLQEVKVLLVDADNAGSADGGYLTIGGVVVNPVASSTGNAYTTISSANVATATYTAGTAGDTSTPQTLYVYAVDSSGATAAVSDAGSTLAFNSRVDTGGIISMSLTSVDADIIAQPSGTTTALSSSSSLGSVTEGASDSYQDIEFYVEGTLAEGAGVSVTLQATDADGDLVSDLTYYTADGSGDYTVQLDSNLFTLASTNISSSPKTVRVFAIDEGQSDVEDLTLSFVTNSSSASAFDNLTKGLGTLAVAEQKASFTVSDPVFSSGSSLSESDTSRTATYTITANDLVSGVPLTVEISTAGGLSVSPSTLDFENTSSATVTQTVTVSATDDSDVEASTHAGTLTFAVAEGSNTTKYAGAISAVSVNITDNDGTGGATANLSFWAQDSDGATPSIVDQAMTVTVGGTTSAVTSSSAGQVDLGAYLGSTIELSASLAGASSSSGVNISDAVAILKHIVGIESVSGSAAVAADVDQSGAVNITDAVEVLKMIVGLTSTAKLLAVDSAGESSLTISSGTVDLTAVVLGDVDGSYSDII